MEETDAIIVGGGPSGLTLSVALSQQGVRNVVLEMNEEICEDPRAITITGDARRTLRVLGVSDDALAKIGQVMTELHFHYNMFSETPFLSINQSTDWLGQAMPMGETIFQPKLEQILRDAIDSSPLAELRTRCRVTARRELPDAVEVCYEDRDQKTKWIRGRFLVGADGKRGIVRKQFLEPLGIKQETGVNEYSGTWIAANLRIHPPTPKSHPDFPLWSLGYTEQQLWDRFWPNGFHFCNDIVSPAATGRFGPPDQKYWRLSNSAGNETVTFPWDCIEVIRCLPAFFAHKVVNRWFDNRTILIGDAAHVFPPFGGQGIANGIRDAHGLSWRLSLLLKAQNNGGVLQTSINQLLDEWSRERREGVDQASIITMLNGNLLMNKSWVFSQVASWASTAVSYLPFLKRWIHSAILTDVEGYRKVGNGFFLAEHDGGGRMAQIWLHDDSPVLSDRLFWTPYSILTLLIVGDALTLSERDSLHQVVASEKLPPNILAKEFVVIHHPSSTQELGTRDQNLGHAHFRACTDAEIHDAGISVPPGYDRTALHNRFKRGTRYVLVRSDFFVFSQASTVKDLGMQLGRLKTMVAIG